MEHTQKTFEVLDTLDRQPIINQRQLAQHAGVSLGQVNYILKSLLDKGLVKAGNFRKSRRKIGYAYLLTPKGIQTKSRLAVKFITSKLEEYDSLRNRLAEKLASIESRNFRQIAFVGPLIVKALLSLLSTRTTLGSKSRPIAETGEISRRSMPALTISFFFLTMFRLE